jgi:antibiotic biosynthesis monooxygenase (ABM) superfamily enzyme
VKLAELVSGLNRAGSTPALGTIYGNNQFYWLLFMELTLVLLKAYQIIKWIFQLLQRWTKETISK